VPRIFATVNHHPLSHNLHHPLHRELGALRRAITHDKALLRCRDRHDPLPVHTGDGEVGPGLRNGSGGRQALGGAGFAGPEGKELVSLRSALGCEDDVGCGVGLEGLELGAFLRLLLEAADLGVLYRETAVFEGEGLGALGCAATVFGLVGSGSGMVLTRTMAVVVGGRREKEAGGRVTYDTILKT
jgi:hypothetical protein